MSGTSTDDGPAPSSAILGRGERASRLPFPAAPSRQPRLTSSPFSGSDQAVALAWGNEANRVLVSGRIGRLHSDW